MVRLPMAAFLAAFRKARINAKGYSGPVPAPLPRTT
jgi:hypothetical protein